jgi:hypothetical protein
MSKFKVNTNYYTNKDTYIYYVFNYTKGNI